MTKKGGLFGYPGLRSNATTTTFISLAITLMVALISWGIGVEKIEVSQNHRIETNQNAINENKNAMKESKKEISERLDRLNERTERMGERVKIAASVPCAEKEE